MSTSSTEQTIHRAPLQRTDSPPLRSTEHPPLQSTENPPLQRTDSPSLPSGKETTKAVGPLLAMGRPEPDLTVPSLPELRSLRRRAQQDEADLSYVRRLLQGRIDILRAELERRGSGAGSGSGTGEGTAAVTGTGDGGGAGTGLTSVVAAGKGPVVARLAEILRDAPARQRSSARHVTLGTPHGEEYRRLAAEMLAEVELSDLDARTDQELSAAMRRLVRYEQQVSRRRQQFQRTADGCSAEIARRYREGEAQVDDLLV
jgi:hypothetical protein